MKAGTRHQIWSVALVVILPVATFVLGVLLTVKYTEYLLREEQAYSATLRDRIAELQAR